MSDRGAFTELQYALAAHIRDPASNDPPAGIEDRRLAIYRELFFNNVSKMLAGTFPVLHEILGASRWRSLTRDYFAHHQAHTPYFLEMPREFLSYLENERGAHPDDAPFMLELAHYEWVELALSVAEEEISFEGLDQDGDLLEREPVVSPLVRVYSYHFPVHRIGPGFQPAKPPPEVTWLVVFRGPDDRVRFLQINQVTARLIELAQEGGRSGRDMLTQIAGELRHQRPEVVVEGGRDILKMLREEAIILGTRSSSNKENPDGRS